MQKDLKFLAPVLRDESGDVLASWLEQGGGKDKRAVQKEASEILRGLQMAVEAGAEPESLAGPSWTVAIEALDALSRARVAQGETAADTSKFVMSLKKPLFAAIQRRLGGSAAEMADAIWALSLLVDQLAQRTVTVYQQTREELIKRQQNELLELSTPVIKLWDGILAVPMIGTLDSSRTQIVMETLLQAIAETESRLAIIDITGVPTVDTLVAQHLLKTVAAIRLMGADCIISGIRPQIAQTMVHLGIDLKGIVSKATLADAFAIAMKQSGLKITREA